MHESAVLRSAKVIKNGFTGPNLISGNNGLLCLSLLKNSHLEFAGKADLVPVSSGMGRAPISEVELAPSSNAIELK